MKQLFLWICLLLVVSSTSAQKNNARIFADNYYRNNEFEKAAVIFRKLSDKNPYDSDLLKKLMSCYQQSNQFQKAQQYLEKRLNRIPNLIFVHVLLGYNYEKQKDTIRSEQQYQKTFDLINSNPSQVVNVAKLFESYTKLDYAIKAYKIVAQRNNMEVYNLKISALYGEQGEFLKMFEAYFNYLDKNPNNYNYVKRRIAKYITDDFEKTNASLFKKSLLKRSVSNPKDVWNILLSWFFTIQKEYSKAFIQEKALYVRGSYKNLHKFNSLGNIAYQNNYYEEAKRYFDFVIEKSSSDDEKIMAHVMLIKILMQKKEPNVEQRFQELFNAYGFNKKTLKAQVAYADYQLSLDKPNLAIETLNKAMQFTPNKYQEADIKLKLADVLVYKRNFNKALLLYTQVQNYFKNHRLAHESRFKVAKTSYFKQDFKWAKSQLKVLKGSATQLIANDATDLFLIISDNEPKDSIKTGLHKYSIASLLAYRNKNKEAIKILSEILVEFKGQPIEDETLYKQAKLYIKEDQFDKAIDNFLKLIALNKKGVFVDDSIYNLAEVYAKQEKIAKAKAYYQKIIFEHPSSIYLVDARKKYRKLRGDSIN